MLNGADLEMNYADSKFQKKAQSLPIFVVVRSNCCIEIVKKFVISSDILKTFNKQNLRPRAYIKIYIYANNFFWS